MAALPHTHTPTPTHTHTHKHTHTNTHTHAHTHTYTHTHKHTHTYTNTDTHTNQKINETLFMCPRCRQRSDKLLDLGAPGYALMVVSPSYPLIHADVVSMRLHGIERLDKQSATVKNQRYLHTITREVLRFAVYATHRNCTLEVCREWESRRKSRRKRECGVTVDTHVDIMKGYEDQGLEKCSSK